MEPTATEILSKLVRDQHESNPALAEKQQRLIDALRVDHGSDEKVVERLATIFGVPSGPAEAEIDSDGELGDEDLEPDFEGSDDECPICGSHDECPHLLAYIDMTFGEIVGGYCAERMDAFASLITAEFRARQKQAGRVGASWVDAQIEDLWTEATAALDNSDEPIEIDAGALSELLVSLLEGEADAHGITFNFQGAPGTSAVFRVFHDESPARVFQKALSGLETRLASGWR